jgi:hypothetical protein
LPEKACCAAEVAARSTASSKHTAVTACLYITALGASPAQPHHSLAHVGAAHFGVEAVAVLLHAARLAALASFEVRRTHHLRSSAAAMRTV